MLLVNILLISSLHLNSIALKFIAEILMYRLASVFVWKEPSAVILRRYSEVVCKRFHVEVVWEEQYDGMCSGAQVLHVDGHTASTSFLSSNQLSFWPMGTGAFATEGFLRDSRIFGTSVSVNPTVTKTQAQCGNTELAEAAWQL